MTSQTIDFIFRAKLLFRIRNQDTTIDVSLPSGSGVLKLQEGPGHEEVGASSLKEAPEAARDRGWWRMTKRTIGWRVQRTW